MRNEHEMARVMNVGRANSTRARSRGLGQRVGRLPICNASERFAAADARPMASPQPKDPISATCSNTSSKTESQFTKTNRSGPDRCKPKYRNRKGFALESFVSIPRASSRPMAHQFQPANPRWRQFHRSSKTKPSPVKASPTQSSPEKSDCSPMPPISVFASMPKPIPSRST